MDHIGRLRACSDNSINMFSRTTKSQYSQNFLPFSKFMKRPQTKFQAHTMRKSLVIRLNKSKFMVGSNFSCSTVFFSLSIFNWNYNNRCYRTSQHDNSNKSLCSTVVKLWRRHWRFSQLTVSYHLGERRLEQKSSKIHWTRVIWWRSDNNDNYVGKAQ